MSRRSVLKSMGYGAAGIAGVALIGCGEDEPEGGASATAAGGGGGAAATSAGAGATTAPAASADEIKRGGKLTTGFLLEAGTLDPFIGTSGGDAPFVNALNDSLVEYRGSEPDTNISLAHEWEVPDATQLVFHLREGVKFHDGSDFNSEVVKWNIEHMQDPETKAVLLAFLSAIETVDTPDEHTVVLNLNRPNSALINALAGYRASMVPPEAFERLGTEFGGKPVGLGQWELIEWNPASHLKTKANKNYWGKDANGGQVPYMDEYEIRVIPDDTVRFAELTTGGIDISSISIKDFAAGLANPDLTMVKSDEINGPSCPVVNFDMAPLDDDRLRRAVFHALDASVVSKLVYQGYGEAVTDGLWPRTSWAGSVIPERANYNPDEAKKLMDGAGKPDGFDFDMITYASTLVVQQTEIYQEQLAQLGINATVTTQDVSTATTSFFNEGKFPMYSTYFGTARDEPHGTAALVFQSDSYYNPVHREIAPGFDDLIASGVATYDQEERKEIYQQMATTIMDICFFMPMVYTYGYTAHQKDLRGPGLDVAATGNRQYGEVWRV